MRHQGDHESSRDTVKEEARHREDHDSGSNTVRGDFPTQEHPSAPEPLVRQSPSDHQNLPHQAVVTVQPSPPRPLYQTVAEDLSRAADSLQTDIELLRAAAESLEAAAPTPTISGESSTERQPNDNPQEQTQQSSAQTFANLLTPPPQTSIAHGTPAVRPKPTTATRPYRSHKWEIRPDGTRWTPWSRDNAACTASLGYWDLREPHGGPGDSKRRTIFEDQPRGAVSPRCETMGVERQAEDVRVWACRLVTQSFQWAGGRTVSHLCRMLAFVDGCCQVATGRLLLGYLGSSS